MEMIFFLPILFFLFIVMVGYKPNPRIALLGPAERRSFLLGTFLVAVPPAAALPVLMYFLFASSPDRPVVVGIGVLVIVAVASLVIGLRWISRALATVPEGKLKPSVGVDEIA